jgi:hypothetical protein
MLHRIALLQGQQLGLLGLQSITKTQPDQAQTKTQSGEHRR